MAANYTARLDRLEQRIGTTPVRYVWINPGETRLAAATRYVDERKLDIHPSVFLNDERTWFIGWRQSEAAA